MSTQPDEQYVTVVRTVTAVQSLPMRFWDHIGDNNEVIEKATLDSIKEFETLSANPEDVLLNLTSETVEVFAGKIEIPNQQ